MKSNINSGSNGLVEPAGNERDEKIVV